MAQRNLPPRGFLFEFENFWPAHSRGVEELLASPVNFDEFVCNHELPPLTLKGIQGLQIA
jgi:hypothetical protein